MVILKQRILEKGKIIELEETIVEIVKNKKVVATIYPEENGIRIVSERFVKIEANNGENFCPPLPLVIIDF